MAPSRFLAFSGLLAALAVSTFYPSSSSSRLQTLSPLALGFLLGLLVAETPLASTLQQLFGLTTRHPDKVGLDILHGGVHPASSPSDGSGDQAERKKSELNQRTMYGLQHAFLNLEVTGWWFNMGLWDKEQDGNILTDKEETKPKFKVMRFQDACQALVRKVTSGLDINTKSHILGKVWSVVCCFTCCLFVASKYSRTPICCSFS